MAHFFSGGPVELIFPDGGGGSADIMNYGPLDDGSEVGALFFRSDRRVPEPGPLSVVFGDRGAFALEVRGVTFGDDGALAIVVPV